MVTAGLVNATTGLLETLNRLGTAPLLFLLLCAMLYTSWQEREAERLDRKDLFAQIAKTNAKQSVAMGEVAEIQAARNEQLDEIICLLGKESKCVP